MFYCELNVIFNESSSMLTLFGNAFIHKLYLILKKKQTSR